YIFNIAQDGLGLPDRDYYLKDDNTSLRLVRRKYQQHIATALGMLGDANAEQLATDIVALETELARVKWSKADTREPAKTYNKTELAGLAALTPGYDWHSYLVAAGVAGKVSYL